MKRLSKIDAAYLAGLIDGEGSIGIYHNGQTYVGRITIVSTVPTPLYWTRRVLGFGRVRSYLPKIKRHHRGWIYVALSRQASFLVKIVLPFLKIKHKQAKNLLIFQKGINKIGTRINKKELQRRIKHSKISKLLNKRGR